MKNISTHEALAILEKWHEDSAIVQVASRDGTTWWALVSKTKAGDDPYVLLSGLADPFPFFKIFLKEIEFQYGDARAFSDARLERYAARAWVCFLIMEFLDGTKIILSELRRDPPND